MTENNNKNDMQEHPELVREKLLDAAEELFAVLGFSATSVRHITSKAGCNIAAVNYYFGGKDKLYLEVFQRQLRDMTGRRVQVIENVMSGKQGRINLQSLLKKFGEAFLEPLTQNRNTNRLMQLFIQEMKEQKLPPQVFVDEIARPTLSSMREAIKRFCPSLNDKQIVFCVISIVGQLLHLIHIREWKLDSDDQNEFVLPEVSEWIDHVVKFSTAGIESYSEDGQ